MGGMAQVPGSMAVTMGESGAPVDSDRLANLERQLGAQELAGIIDTFLTHATGLAATLRTCVEERDVAAGRRVARQLSSACAVLGVRQPALLCDELEERLRARAALDGELDVNLASLDRSVDAAVAVLVALRRTLGD